MALLETGTEEEVGKILKDFNCKNARTFEFPGFDVEKKKNLVHIICQKLCDDNMVACFTCCLETLRILSRDKNGLEMMTSGECLKTLQRHAGLDAVERHQGEGGTRLRLDSKVVIEAQKCLCNLVFNSTIAQRSCSYNGCVEGIVQRLKTYRDPELPHEVKFFDMRMLFLLTALVADVRPKLRQELHGLTYLMEALDLIIKTSKNHDSGDNRVTDTDVPLADSEVDLACEILKVLFNLTVHVDKTNLDEEEEAHFMRMVSILHDLLICKTESNEKREELISHTVNLLTNMPPTCYDELLTPLNEGDLGDLENKEIECEGQNMEAIVALMEFLEIRLDKVEEKQIRSLKESLTPILSCFCESSRNNRVIRKFLRSKILPPLRDVVHRPEEGCTMRNKLCRLMTSPVTDVKDMVADFLFILCKESVGRLVKYTGYGNAAGLLASRGLMAGGHGNRGQYSSDSSESDTEEYTKAKDHINPVTGYLEPERPDPMEGMTEEQKEYEAVKLVQQLDKLTRDGIVQPMRIGPDGKPQAIGHVLELQEAAAVTQVENNSDADDN